MAELNPAENIAQKPTLPANIEMLIELSLSECLDHICYIAEHLDDRSGNVFIEHLLMSLQELSYWAGGRSSEWQTRKNKKVGENQYFVATSDLITISRMTRVCDIRDTICHRGSPNSLLNPGMRVMGNLNFRQGDVELQYGPTKLMLVGDVIKLYEDLRNFFVSSSHMSRWGDTPYWATQTRKLSLASEKIRSFDFAQTVKERLVKLGFTE